MKIGPALALSVAAVTATLASAGVLAHELQVQARRRSHEQPAWIEPRLVATTPPAELQARGKKLFLASCAHCHGADARGDEGPDLHGLDVSDRRIAAVIHNGIKGEMPSFSKKYGVDETAALTAYLRTLE